MPRGGNVAKTGNLAGVDTPRDIAGSVTEFVPRTVKTKVHQKVTWRIVGDSHTVSFNVPKYLPEITVGGHLQVRLPGPPFDGRRG